MISGDTAASPVLEKNARGVDVLFHEGLQTDMVSILHDVTAANNRPTGAKIMGDIPSYHTRPEDAANIAQAAGVGHLVFYHTIPPLPLSFMNAAFLGDAGKFYKGPITVSEGWNVYKPAGGRINKFCCGSYCRCVGRNQESVCLLLRCSALRRLRRIRLKHGVPPATISRGNPPTSTIMAAKYRFSTRV